MTDPNECPYCNMDHRPEARCPEQREPESGYMALAAEDRARDQRATGPSPEEERRARGLDEEQGIYRAFD